jgi:glycosyltransferase involved in cell wall biosynthesis
MRILVANIPLPQNRFLVDLNAALSEQVEIVHSSDVFWEMQGDFDVVHLHFPEYLTYEIERAYINGLTDDVIAKVETRLRFWSARAAIVITRHVLLPHDARRDHAWEKMYEMVYSYADGIAHFGQASIDEFQERYATTVFARGAPPKHAVIPHHNYASLPNDISRSDARARLGIPSDASVMLVFGAIRNEEERQLVLDTFANIDVPGKVLMVSRWREKLAHVSWIRLKYWIRDLVRLYYRIHPRYRFNYGFVEEKDTQLYLNACDVLFIPRLWVLNSGNVTLGMTFGRVVVGPDSWDVGELLQQVHNPVFDPDDPRTAGAAVERGFQLAKDSQTGEQNRRVALSQWTPEHCAAMYVALFKQVSDGILSPSTITPSH